MKFRGWALLALVGMTGLAGAGAGQERAGGGLLERLQPERLQAVRRDARRLRNMAEPSPRSGEYLDVRTAMHVHSRLSHDSRGTPEEILAAAKQAGIRALFMTEHPDADRKWWTEQVRGEREGVLFIPGAETSDGLLVFRSEGADWTPEAKTPALLERLNAGGGIGIIAHPEKRTDWNLPPFTAMEIYNTHADAEDTLQEKGILEKRNLLSALTLLNAFRQYPAEAFAAIFDPPTPVLKTWDELNRTRQVTGVAGNDAHANTGLVAIVEGGKIVLKDPLGKKIGELDRKDVPAFLFGANDYREGQKLLDVLFDPYSVSLGYVTTHLLAKEVSEAALFDALRAGRAYVSFDWIADPSGFTFTAEHGGRSVPMGGEAPAGARLSARTSLAGTIRLLRNGTEVARVDGKELAATAAEPGVYRIVVTLPVAGEDRPWIYSNPIRVR